eukprot:COSAG04_NODE_135_length_23774_cov_40.993918_11_plen_2893_part_00
MGAASQCVAMAESRAKACFCLSKARDDGMQRNAGVAGDVGDALAALRSELGGLKISALRHRARAAGAPTGDIEEACDAEDSKAATINLILSFQKGKDPMATLRAELEGLKLSAIAERGKAAGASEAEIEEAHDADDAKAAMIDLVLAHQEAEEQRDDDVLAAPLRAELEGLKISALRKRAKEVGAADKDVDEAGDAEDAKAAMIALILANEGGAAAKLASLKPSALRKRAKATGVADEEIDAAGDAGKSALVSLILAHEKQAKDPLAPLRTELEGLKPSALRRRAKSAGAADEEIEEAEDSDDPKGDMISVVLAQAADAHGPVERGPSDRLLSILQAGGDAAAGALTSVLEHAMDVLEQLSADSPRKSRKALRALLESVEEMSEAVNDAWCDGVSRSGSGVLEALASRASAVETLASGDAAADSVSIVSSLLDSLRECGSVAVQAESVLSAESDEASRLAALECVRALSPAPLESVSDSEASLFDVLKDHLCGSQGALSCEDRLACWLSLFVLGCRNGLGVVAHADVMESLVETATVGITALGAAAAAGDMDGELRAHCAAQICTMGLLAEAVGKSTPDVRESISGALGTGEYVGAAGKAFSDGSFAKMISRVVELQLLELRADEDVSVGCGATSMMIFVAITAPKALLECDTERVYGGVSTLLRHACPSPLPAEWWVSTCAEVDVTTVRLGCIFHFLGYTIRPMDVAVLESSSWLRPVLAQAVHVCKMNASAGLSARQTMSVVAPMFALSLMESAARVESHAVSLRDSAVLEALDYACLNDFGFNGASVSNYAAGVLVALVGRNEGGKTLSRSSIFAVLDHFGGYFDVSGWKSSLKPSAALGSSRRVATVAISDANKKIMLQHDKLLDSLVRGLVLDDDNPRRGQQGADTLQEVHAGVLHELALFGPCASALRSHKPTMDALRVLAEAGTKESRECAAGALFELDEETRAAKTQASSNAEPGSAKPPPHIMVSYNWDHQHVILRVVAWLQAHGYLVWVDTEQMKGSTVDAMALAVEGSEVMLIGVSRPYKESSNCRMEAQYGLQKKKAMIPLMMQEGYEADGWLGLLLGTSLWYALYGSTLESESAFEDRMSALSRELGPRGRADAVVAASSQDEEAAPEPDAEESDAVAALRSELEGMRLRGLERRALSEGVSADAVDDAMDGDDPKMSLTALIVDAVSSRGPSDRLLSALTAGGETAADALSTALDHAMDVLEQASMSSPRKARKSILELMESVEELSESVDAVWCDGVSRCKPDRLGALVNHAMAAQALKSDTAGPDSVAIVSSLLQLLRECGSVVVQCESVLAVDGGSDESTRLDALECVRGLSTDSLGSVSGSEASLFGVLKDHLCESTMSCEEQLSCWLSVFVLGCRNGVAVVARVDVLEPILAGAGASIAPLGAAVASSNFSDALRVCSAAHLCAFGLVGWESAYKSPPDIRAPFEKRYFELLKSYVGRVAKAFCAESCGKVIAEVIRLQLLEQDGEDASVGCGAVNVLAFLAAFFPKGLKECDTEALFGSALALLRNVCLLPLPVEWWGSTCAEVDVTSMWLGLLMHSFGSNSKLLDKSTLESASWLGPMLAEAVHICKVNASEGLSARPTMSLLPVAMALQLVETAARVESHAASLLDSGVIESLEYACVNEFSYSSFAVSNYAAGAVVALVGRNEGGKTLSRSTVNAVLDSHASYFDPTHWRHTNPAARVLPTIRRVATVAIADANKKAMLQHDKLLDSLLTGLLLDDDNPRRGQDGADALQEACAGVLHELALHGPGATVLREHSSTMDALHALAESGTKESRERAAGALFELDEETRATKTTKAGDAEPGASKPPPHIMVSYNWDHQHVILRVVAWLQAHGYLVWVDTEQMKGSTVDAMALAVEGSEVMLIGVCRPYKESSNCRMEAQYGLQKKKAMIPLMMQEGYEADGWLGLLLGTSLWYALYGATLESESAFEDRMSALSREIGSRGRADAVVKGETPESCPESDESEAATALRSELGTMRLRALEQRALSEGASADAIDDAMDSEDPKASLISLIVEAVSSRGPVDQLLSALQVGGDTAADALASVLEHAMDVLEQLTADSPRKSRKALRALLESVEDTSDTVDDAWCDGVSRCGSGVLEALASRVSAVERLASGGVAADTVSIVSSLLDSLCECGSVAVQCESVLSVDSGSDEAARLGALKCVRALSTALLDSVSKSEASLFDVLKDHLCGSQSALSCEERLSCWLSLLVLGCRNGVSVVARVEVLESLGEATSAHTTKLGAAAATADMDGELRASCAAYVFTWGVVHMEGGCKCPPEAAARAVAFPTLKAYLGVLLKALNDELFARVIARVIKLHLLEPESAEDVSLGCGAASLMGWAGVMFPKGFEGFNTETIFGGACTLLRCVCPSPLPAEWWVSTCAELDATSASLGDVMHFFHNARPLDPAVLESSSWLGPVLAHAVHICKVNASVDLSARPTMAFTPVGFAINLLETAARVASHAASLRESSVLEALDYACQNDFSFLGSSISNYSAGALVALVGRNEGGKTLSRSSVFAVLDHFTVKVEGRLFKVSNVLPSSRRVTTVAVADANKKAMLQHDKLLESLVDGLLLDDDPRRGQDGADALQEMCAGVLHELALYGPGATKLRSHKPTMDALRILVEAGTKESRERAAGALFELDQETRAVKTKTADAATVSGSTKPPPHIMVSYRSSQLTSQRYVQCACNTSTTDGASGSLSLAAAFSVPIAGRSFSICFRTAPSCFLWSRMPRPCFRMESATLPVTKASMATMPTSVLISSCGSAVMPSGISRCPAVERVLFRCSSSTVRVRGRRPCAGGWMGEGGGDKVYRPPPKPRDGGPARPRPPARRYSVFVRKVEGRRKRTVAIGAASCSGPARAVAVPSGCARARWMRLHLS